MADSEVRYAQWIGDDDPERLEAVAFTLLGDSLTATGVSRARDYALSWSLETGTRWVTRRINVSVHGVGWRRSLCLTREDNGSWNADSNQCGSPALPPPGLSPSADFGNALDCDLGLCPFTNTMPIRRLSLINARDTSEHVLTMAWIDVPSLHVTAAQQRYSAAPPLPTGETRVHYSSLFRDFESDLTIDEDGIVIDYPQIARRVYPSPRQ